MKSEISSKLQSLNKVTRDLVQCQSLDEVVKKALAEVRESLKVQVASIFLLSKEGVIERVGINGVDRDDKPIPDIIQNAFFTTLGWFGSAFANFFQIDKEVSNSS